MALQHLPDSRGTRVQAIDLRLALRAALQPLGDVERILRCLREAEALAEALNDQPRLGHVCLFLSLHCYHMRAHDQALAAAQRALALATTSGDGVQHALATYYLGLASHGQGDHRRAIDYFSQAAAFFDGARGRERFGHFFLPAVVSRAHLAWCHAELGTFAEGRALGDAGLLIAEAVAHLASLMFAYYGVGLLALRQGDLCRALSLLARAVGICQDTDLPLSFPLMASALGTAYTLCGRVVDAMPLLTQAMEQTTATAMVVQQVLHQVLCSLSLGEAQVLAGRLEEAHALAERALALARAHQERSQQAYALRLLGDIAARREPPDVEPTEASYRQALACAEELGMRPLQAHYHRGLGTLYAQTGRREQARAALSTAITLYRAMAMTFWLPEAEAVLAQVEAR